MSRRSLLRALHLVAIGLLAVSGGVPGQAQSFQPTYEDGIARRGKDYRFFYPTGPSALYCQQACLSEPQCLAWSYSPPGALGHNRPMCWLKNDVPAQANAPGIVSGIVRPAGPTPAANTKTR